MSDEPRRYPPTMLDIDSSRVTEPERIFSCPHVVVTLKPDTLVPPPQAGEAMATLKAVDAKAAAIYRILTTGSPEKVWPAANWVLVQGCSGSDSIDGVYGPYTEAHADWLLKGPLASSYAYWTKHKLSSGPEEP